MRPGSNGIITVDLRHSGSIRAGSSHRAAVPSQAASARIGRLTVSTLAYGSNKHFTTGVNCCVGFIAQQCWGWLSGRAWVESKHGTGIRTYHAPG
jgi:hypothetical protein